MKHKNSVSDFTSERNEFLLNRFREELARQSQISLEKAFKVAADAPAPRFWVSEARAAAVIGHMVRGKDVTASMFGEKRRMYEEIYRRFSMLRRERAGSTIAELVFEVVNQEAPCSYLSEDRARVVVYAEKRRRRMERRGV